MTVVGMTMDSVGGRILVCLGKSNGTFGGMMHALMPLYLAHTRPRNKSGCYTGHYDWWITKFTGHSGIYAGHCHSIASFFPSTLA
jgi:hypothetical protein